MTVHKLKTNKQISDFLYKVVYAQNDYEQNLKKDKQKKNGIYLTNSLYIVEDILNIIDLENNIFLKRILEPACGQGIFILKLIAHIYSKYPNENLIAKFISENIYFIDIQKEMIEETKKNIRYFYYFLFNKEFTGTFNAIATDFTDKKSLQINSLFNHNPDNIFKELYNSFDYVIGNPPYVTLYGRRDKKKDEAQRKKYLQNYRQFPDSVKNGKINLVMLFLEHSLDFLKENGKLSFIIDVAFFETAYQYTRKYLLENCQITELQINITHFNVASGQIILKLIKSKSIENKVKIINHKTKNSYFMLQKDWYNKDDEYRFRYNNCQFFKQIINKITQKQDKTILELFPNKNLRTNTMLLNMEDKFTLVNKDNHDEQLIYPYYQGSKSLSEKFGKLSFSRYFYYNKPLQDKINDELKIELEKQGIKNKKRIGLGETIIYDNPKIFIRQSAKEIIATLDLKKSAANNSLYVFSLRSNSSEAIDFLYFMCGFLNSDFITYYAQQMNIIRFSQGKQPQIKISDLGSIYIPLDTDLRNEISKLCKIIYQNTIQTNICKSKINNLIYKYYELNESQINTIQQSIKSF